MPDHTPEPWHLGKPQRSSPFPDAQGKSLTIIAPVGWGNEKWPQQEQTIARAHWTGNTSIMECLANARRIVACVNKLADWSIEELEDETIKAAKWNTIPQRAEFKTHIDFDLEEQHA